MTDDFPPDNVSDETVVIINFLAGRDVPCPVCEYNLRDLRIPRCPECGEELALRMSLADPKLGSLIAGLVGLSAGAGLNGLLLLYAVIQIFLRGSGRWLHLFIIINGIGFVVTGFSLAMWIKARHRIRRITGVVRWALVIACWLLTLADLLIFSFSIR